MVSDHLVCVGINVLPMYFNPWVSYKASPKQLYIAVYVDDLLIATRDPGEIKRTLENAHKFKLKSVGPLTYHLGCNYFCDKDGTLCYGPCKYIAKILDQFEKFFGCKPKEYTSPLGKGDHPETDNTEE
jgi:Reverse transcriptase (RNA-dependent DNA polymerase)